MRIDLPSASRRLRRLMVGSGSDGCLPGIPGNTARVLFAVLATLLWTPLQAQVAAEPGSPYAIPYQTVLRRTSEGGTRVPLQGTGYFKFVLYRSVPGGGDTGLEPVWSHDPDYLAGLDPARSEPIPEPVRWLGLEVVDGIASALLGGLVPSLLDAAGDPALDQGEPVRMPPLSPADFLEGSLRLRVWFSEQPSDSEPLIPDMELAASPYAIRSAVADAVAPGAVDAGGLSAALQGLLTQLQGIQQVQGRAVLMSDRPDDPELLAAGYSPVRTLSASPWIRSSGSGAPSGRVDAVSAWTGSLFLVWGGALSEGGEPSGTGARHEPGTDSWTPMAIVGAPSPRSGAVSVWTGSRWVVWGGLGTDGMRRDGALYDPVRNQWSAMSLPPDGFEERMECTAVWTGTHMLVWGGRSLSGMLADGAAWEASTGQWTLLPSFPGAARAQHRAVWTGTQMLVWGGQSGEQTGLADGYRFLPGSNPATGTWESLPASGLTGRWAPAMVWTERGLFLWGGRTATAFLDSGALWDPVSGTWQPLPEATGFLGPASHALAEPTPAGVFVHGGLRGGGVSGAGAFYNPADDLWFAPPQGGPSARRGHTMHFLQGTGEILLFGGADPSVFGAFSDLWRIPAERTQYLYRRP